MQSCNHNCLFEVHVEIVRGGGGNCYVYVYVCKTLFAWVTLNQNQRNNNEQCDQGKYQRRANENSKWADKKKPHWSSSDQVNIYFCLNLTGLEGCVHPNPWTVLTLNWKWLWRIVKENFKRCLYKIIQIVDKLETTPLRVVVSYAYLVFSQPPACLHQAM